MSPLPQKLDLALVTRLREVVAGEPATEAELRALDDEAGGWVRATEAQLHAAEQRLTELNADPASPLAEIADEVRRARGALTRAAGSAAPDRRAGAAHTGAADGVAQAPRGRGVAVRPESLELASSS